MSQNIVIDIDARTRDFENALDQLSAKVRSTASQIDKAFASSATGAVQGTNRAVSALGVNLKSISVIAAGEIIARQFENAANKVKAFGNQLYSQMERMQNTEMKLKSIVATDMIKTGKAADYQTAMAQSEKAKDELMAWFKQLSLVSPYEYMEVIDAFTTNANMGQTVDTAKKTTKAILELGSGLGMTQEMMKGFSRALAQTSATRRITQQDLNQFANNGFGRDKMMAVFDMIGQKYDMVIEDHNAFNNAVKSGKVSIDDFFDALAEYAGANYGGSVEAMASTIGGLKSSLGDIKANALNDLFLEASKTISKTLKPYIEYLMELLTSGNFTKWGKNINKRVEEWIKPFQKIGATLENGDMMRGIRNIQDFLNGKTVNTDALKYLLEELGGNEFANTWISRLSDIKGYIDRFLEHKDTIIAALKGIGIAFATAFAVNTVTNLISSIARLNPSLVALTALGAAFGIAWQQNLWGIQDKVKGFVESAKNYIGTLKSIYEDKGLPGVWEKLRQDGENAFQQLPAKVEEALSSIGTYIDEHKSEWFRAAEQGVYDIVGFIFGPEAETNLKTKCEEYKTTIEEFVNNVNQKFTEIEIGDLSEKWQGLANAIEPIQSLLANTFSDAIQDSIHTVKTDVGNMAEIFEKDTWVKLGKTILDIGKVLGAIFVIQENMRISDIAKEVQAVTSSATNLLSIAQNLIETLDNLWTVIKKTFSGDLEAADLSNLKDSVRGLADSIAIAIEESISLALDNLMNKVFSIMEALNVFGLFGDVSEQKKQYQETVEQRQKQYQYRRLYGSEDVKAGKNALDEFFKLSDMGLYDRTDPVEFGRYLDDFLPDISKNALSYIADIQRDADNAEGETFVRNLVDNFDTKQFLKKFSAGFEESGMSWLEYGKQFELTAEEALMFEKQRAETYEKEFQNWINPPTKNFEGGYVDKQKLSEFYRNTPFGKNDNFEDYKRAAFDYAYTGFFSAVVEEAEKEMPDLSKKTTIEPQQALEELAGETENASYSVKEFNADILEALSILSGVTFDYSENSPAVVGKEIGDTIFEKARKKMDGLTQVSPDEAQKVADSVMKTVQKVFPKKQQGFITAGNGTDYIDVYAYVRESIDTLSNTMANTDLSGASVADLSETYSRLSGLLSHYDGENFSWRDNPEQFKRELAASVGNSVLPDDIRTMFLSIMDNATTDADLAKMTAEAITTQISQSGILEREESASSAQSNKPKPDWDFYRQFIGAEEKRWYAQYEQAIRTQMVENGAFVDESGQFDYVAFQKAASAKPDSKEGKAWTEEWTKAVQSLIEAVENGEKVSGFQVYDYAGQYDMYSPLLGQRLNDIYVQIGETIGSFSDITSENFADAVSFITDSQAWQNFAENAMFKSDLDPEATAKEMFTLLEKIGANPEWVQEFKTDTLTELSTLTPDKQLEMIQTLIRGVDNAIDLANGDNTEALKRIETVVAGKTTSGGTTTGQMTMNEIVQNWDKAKASGNKETMKMYEIMLDSAIGSLYYDDNDDSKSGFIGQLKDLNGVPKLTAAQILDEGVGGAGWKTLMNIASNGFFSDAYFKENFNQQYGLHLKWIEDNLKRQEEVEKTVAELGEGAGLQTTPENKSKGMLSLLFGDDFDLSELGAQLFAGLSESLTTLNDNLNPETVELLTTLANFSFDDTQLENWQSFATAIDMVGTALNAMKEAFGMADEGMQTDAMGGGMMTAEGGGGLLGMLQQLIGMEIDTTQWEAFAEVVQMVADAFDTINTALTGGGEEMEGAEGAASAGLLQSLQAMNQIITDFPLTLETFCEYLASDLPEAAALAKAALGEVTIDEEGNTKAGEGNTLYTSVGAIYGLFQDINATLLTFIGILKERIPATVRAFQPIVGEFVGMAEEIAAAGYGVADAWNAAAAAIQLAMQAIDDAKGKDWTVPSVGGGDGGGGGGGVFAAGGTSGFRYGTAIVGEHGPELVTNNGSRAWTVFSNSHLMGEIAHTRHALNMLSNSAEMVAYNRLMGSGSSNTTTDNSQHFENHFGAVIGDDAFRSMVDDEVRRVWRREMRLAS